MKSYVRVNTAATRKSAYVIKVAGALCQAAVRGGVPLCLLEEREAKEKYVRQTTTLLYYNTLSRGHARNDNASGIADDTGISE